MKIKISADSTCDLSPELIEKNDISIAPLYVIKGDRSYKDMIEISPDDVFAYERETGNLCSTSAINVSDYANMFSEYLKTYDAVIHINISSDFSTCYQNACIAAENFENVYVVDSRNLSSGTGHIVLDAAQMAREGVLSPSEIADILREKTAKLEVSFIINTLDYLKKGGRCSTLAALGANILKIRPCIEVIDGKMSVGKKYRGTIDAVFAKYIEDRLSGRDDIDYRRIFITHSSIFNPEALEIVKSSVEKFGQFEEIIETIAGCTISSHCGPDCLGILFYRK